MLTNNEATCDICGKTINQITDNVNIFKLPLNRKPSHCCNNCKEIARKLIKEGEIK